MRPSKVLFKPNSRAFSTEAVSFLFGAHEIQDECFLGFFRGFFGGGGQKRIFHHPWSQTTGSQWRNAWKVLCWTQTREQRTSTTYMTLEKTGTVLPLFACLTGQSVSISARKRGVYCPKMDEPATLIKPHSNSTWMSSFSCPSSFVIVPYVCWTCGLLRLLTHRIFFKMKTAEASLLQYS